jgi:hypothetical protein
VGVACVSLAYASTMLSYVLAVTMFAFMLFSALGAVYADRARRAFWGGFAIVGWSLLASVYLPARVPLPWSVSHWMLNRAHESVVREIAVSDKTARSSSESPYFRDNSFYVQSPPHGPFVTSGQILAAFISTMLGGMAAQRFYDKSSRD